MVFAGYPKQMKAFMAVNPGIEGRIQKTFDFAVNSARGDGAVLGS